MGDAACFLASTCLSCGRFLEEEGEVCPHCGEPRVGSAPADSPIAVHKEESMTVAVLVAPLFEESELIYPYYRLQEAGYEVALVGPEAKEYAGKHGVPVTADRAAADVDPGQLRGIVIPGGYSPDHMRRSRDMVELVRKVGEGGRPVAAICHAGWMLVSAGLAEGRRLTSFFSIRDDLEAAGGKWVDEEVVVDGNVITSRNPRDLPAFMRAVLAALVE